MTVWEPEAPEDAQKVLNTALEARGKKDYALFSTVCSPQFLAFVTKELFEATASGSTPTLRPITGSPTWAR